MEENWFFLPSLVKPEGDLGERIVCGSHTPTEVALTSIWATVLHRLALVVDNAQETEPFAGKVAIGFDEAKERL